MKRRTRERGAWTRSGARESIGAFLLGSLLLPGLLAAQEASPDERIETSYRWIERSTRLGLFGGQVFASRGKLELGPGDALTLGTRLRARVSSPVSLELSASFGSSDRYVVDPRLETGPAVVDTVGLDWLLAQFSLQLALTGARTWRGWQPYVVLGGGILVGVSEEQSDVFALSADEDFRFELGTKPVILLGLGVERILSDRLGVTLEARDQLWRIKTPDGFFRLDVLETILESGAEAPEESQWTHNIELSIGAYYYF